MYPTRGRARVIQFFAVFLLITSCTIFYDEQERVVHRFLTAQQENDLVTLYELSDPDYAEQMLTEQSLMIGMSGLLGLSGLGGMEYEYKDLRIQTVQENGSFAIVNVSGRLSATILSTPMTVPFEWNYELANISGDWLVRGLVP